MKRRALLSGVLLLILLPVFAFANVLGEGWEEADIGALKEAVSQINGRILELTMAQVEAAEQAAPLVFEGKGPSIINFPIRKELLLLVRATEAKRKTVTVEGTGSAQGALMLSFLGSQQECIIVFAPRMVGFAPEVDETSLIITAQNAWTLEFFDPPAGGSLDFSGKGAAVSGVFGVGKGGILPFTISYDARKHASDCVIIDLYYEWEGRWIQKQLIADCFSGKERNGTRNGIVEIPAVDNAFYVVNAGPKTTWSITIEP